MSGPLRWLFLDLNSFFASCEQQMQPHLRDRPIGVIPTEAETTCCIAASYTAKAFGIRTGTPVHEARSRCPDIIFVRARPHEYVKFHHRVLEAIDKHLYVDDIISIDEVACRLTGRQQEPEEALMLARRIKAQILQDVGLCLTSSVGLAPNKFLGKVGSNMQKPDGLTMILPEELPHRLHKLKLRDLPGIGPRMEARLHRCGIFSMEQLCATDSLHLRAIWGGVGGLKFHGDLHGLDLPGKPTETTSLGHQHVLAPGLRSYEPALDITRRLLMKAAERMRNNGFYARELHLQVKLIRDQGHIESRLRFTETQDTGLLMRLLEAMWAEHMPGRIPLRTGILLADLVPASAHQPTLFDRPKSEALMRTVDALNARFGRYSVTFGVPVTEARKTGMDKIAFKRVPTLAETGLIPSRLRPERPS